MSMDIAMIKEKKLPIVIILVGAVVVLMMSIVIYFVLSPIKCGNLPGVLTTDSNGNSYAGLYNDCSKSLFYSTITYSLIFIGLMLNLIGFLFFSLKDSMKNTEDNDYYIQNNFKCGFWFNLIGFFFQAMGSLIQFIKLVWNFKP